MGWGGIASICDLDLRGTIGHVNQRTSIFDSTTMRNSKESDRKIEIRKIWTHDKRLRRNRIQTEFEIAKKQETINANAILDYSVP